MMLLCKVGDIETAVVGWAPGKNGPMAMVAWRNKTGSYGVKAVALSEVELIRLPPKLKRRLKKLDDKRHERALENTKKFGELTAAH